MNKINAVDVVIMLYAHEGAKGRINPETGKDWTKQERVIDVRRDYCRATEMLKKGGDQIAKPSPQDIEDGQAMAQDLMAQTGA